MRQHPCSSTPVIGIPCYRHTCDQLLGRQASAMADSYIRALDLAGAAALLIPVTSSHAALRRLFDLVDGMLLAGGPDVDPAFFGQTPHPALRQVTIERDHMEIKLLKWALAEGRPLLGICRGIQVLNVAAGGTLWQDLAAQVPQSAKHDYHPGYPQDRLSHTVEIDPNSRLADIIGTRRIKVNSLHHQAVRTPADGLKIVARSRDGVIEALEGTAQAWVVGVQWHPEWLVPADVRMVRLFKTFTDACRS